MVGLGSIPGTALALVALVALVIVRFTSLLCLEETEAVTTENRRARHMNIWMSVPLETVWALGVGQLAGLPPFT